MAAEIKKRFGVEVELIQGANGVFDVRADGRLVYSKDQTGRFPENREVLDAIASLQTA